MKYREEKPGWNKWVIVCDIFGEKIPRHTNFVQATKIGNQKCQLTLMTKYIEHIDKKAFNEFVNSKKYILLSLKNYFDNFYSP